MVYVSVTELRKQLEELGESSDGDRATLAKRLTAAKRRARQQAKIPKVQKKAAPKQVVAPPKRSHSPKKISKPMQESIPTKTNVRETKPKKPTGSVSVISYNSDNTRDELINFAKAIHLHSLPSSHHKAKILNYLKSVGFTENKKYSLLQSAEEFYNTLNLSNLRALLRIQNKSPSGTKAKLIARLLDQGSDYENELNAKKLVELRDMAKKLGVSPNGSKAAVINRIIRASSTKTEDATLDKMTDPVIEDSELTEEIKESEEEEEEESSSEDEIEIYSQGDVLDNSRKNIDHYVDMNKCAADITRDEFSRFLETCNRGIPLMDGTFGDECGLSDHKIQVIKHNFGKLKEKYPKVLREANRANIKRMNRHNFQSKRTKRNTLD